jgi:hypothetical protein
MVIHSSGIIKLDYNPATDILVTSMPDIRQFEMAEVKYCLCRLPNFRTTLEYNFK